MANTAFAVIGPVFRQYGVALAVADQINPFIPVPLVNAGAFLSGVSLAVSDVKVSKNGGAEANIAAAPTEIGTTGIYKLVLSGTEMQGSVVTVHFKKAGTFDESIVIIETRLGLGQIAIDASAVGVNVTAFALQGVGVGHGISSTGGAGGNGIQATGGNLGLNGIFAQGAGPSGAGIYAYGGGTNSDGFSGQGFGTGVGMRLIGGATGHGLLSTGGSTSGYGMKALTNGSAASLNNNFFECLEGTEPSGAIASNATFGQILQYIKRRFFNKNTQTSTTQTQYKDDSSTSCQTRTSSDDGTTQTLGKAS